MNAAVVTAIAAVSSALVAGGLAVIQALVSQRRQLKHDREIRELQVLRDALDEALTSARQRYGVTNELWRRRVFGERAIKELAGTQPLVPIARAKLVVRLGRAHPVAESYNTVRRELGDLRRLITGTFGEGESADARQLACHDQAERVRRALDDFTDKAAGLAEIDPAVLAAGWDFPASQRSETKSGVAPD